MFRFGLSVLFLVMFAHPALADTKMYKWTDDEGNVHYTQNPPPSDYQATPINPSVPSVSNKQAEDKLKQIKDKAGLGAEKTDTEKDNGKLKKEKQAVYKANCELAKEKLSRVNNNPRVYAIEDGKRRKLTEEERQQRIQQAKENIKKYCK